MSAPITNSNSWIFYFSATQLTISKGTIVQTFTLPDTYFSQAGLFDASN